MGLRSSLQDLLLMQEASGAARQATKAYEADTRAIAQRDELKALSQDIPGLIEQGNLGQLAGRAYGLGDTGVLDRTLGLQATQQANAQKSEMDKPMGLEDLRVNYPEISDAKLQSLAKIPSFADQQKALSTGATIEGNKINRDIKFMDAGERRDERLQKTRTDFADKVSKAVEPLRKEVDTLEELANRNYNDTTEFWLTATKILKSIGGEAGALTDSDLQRPFPATAGRTLNSLAIWMGGLDPNKNPIDPKTIASVKGIVQAALANRKARLEKRSAEALTSNLTSRRDRLVDAENGYIDPIAMEEAAKYGQVVSVDPKTGKISVGKSVPVSTTKFKPDPDLKGGEDAMQLISRLSPKNQAFALQKLQTFKGQVPPGFIERLKSLQGK